MATISIYFLFALFLVVSIANLGFNKAQVDAIALMSLGGFLFLIGDFAYQKVKHLIRKV